MAALLDRIDLVEKMRRRRRRLGGYWIRLEKKAAETERKRTKEKGMVYKGGPVVPGDC